MKITTTACAALVAILMLANTWNGSSASLPDFPERPTLDQAEMLSTKQRDHLDARVQAFMDKTSMQIRLVTVVDTAPYPTASAYAEDLYHQWKLGNRSTHNGLLLVIAGSVGTNSHDMQHYCRIMTGWGIVRIIPDDAVISIKHEYMMARLPDQPFLAFNNTLDVLFARIEDWHSKHPNDKTIQGSIVGNQEVSATQAPEQETSTDSGAGSAILIIVIMVVIVIVALIISAILSGSSTPSYYASPKIELRTPPSSVPVASTAPAPITLAAAAVPTAKEIPRTIYSSKVEQKSKKKSSSDGGSGCGTTIAACGTTSSSCSSASCGGGGGCGGGGCGS
ncbi:MAG: TPM domain-containing protein [Patescibacteria group bacterium]